MSELTTKEKREQKRANEILDAAQEVFLEKGYYGATVNDIAERALISKFTVYQYFGGKDVILNAILARGYSVLTRFVRKHIEGIQESQKRLFALIHAELAFFENRKDFFGMLLVEKLDFESEVKNDILPSYREHLRFIEKELRASIKKKCCRSVNAEDAAYMVFGTLRAFALRWLFRGAKGKLTDKSDCVYDLIMKGLEKE
jgi:TetR/AcrR family transcriptional regulator